MDARREKAAINVATRTRPPEGGAAYLEGFYARGTAPRVRDAEKPL